MATLIDDLNGLKEHLTVVRTRILTDAESIVNTDRERVEQFFTWSEVLMRELAIFVVHLEDRS